MNAAFGVLGAGAERIGGHDAAERPLRLVAAVRIFSTPARAATSSACSASRVPAAMTSAVEAPAPRASARRRGCCAHVGGRGSQHLQRAAGVERCGADAGNPGRAGRGLQRRARRPAPRCGSPRRSKTPADQRALRILRAVADQIGGRCGDSGRAHARPRPVVALTRLVELIDPGRDRIGGGRAARLDLARRGFDAIDQQFLETRRCGCRAHRSVRRRARRTRDRLRRRAARSGRPACYPCSRSCLPRCRRASRCCRPTSLPPTPGFARCRAMRESSISSSERVRLSIACSTRAP